MFAFYYPIILFLIKDNEELEFTDNAFDVIGFSADEKWDCYKLTASVMSMGEMRFKQKGRDDQAEPVTWILWTLTILNYELVFYR